MSSIRESLRRARLSLRLAAWTLLVLLVVAFSVAGIAMWLLDRSMARAWQVERAELQTRLLEGEGLKATEVIKREERTRALPSPEVRALVLEHFRALLPQLLLPVLALGVLGAALLTDRAMRPIMRVIDSARRILDTGDLDARVEVPRQPGPLWELAVLFNRMLDRIEGLVEGMRASLDNVAHDLRTPLTRLRARAESALERPGGRDELLTVLADCLEDAQQVLEMLQVLMDLAEAETESLALQRRPVRVLDVVERVVDLYELVAEEKDLQIEVDIPPSTTVLSDPARLRQVLANLVDNAIKYTARKGATVRIGARTAGDDEVVIEVCDEGIGIRSEDLPRVWKRLYRGDPSRSERGLGLGLSLVRALVQALGGDVEVESERGRGSTFRIRLPKADTQLARRSDSTGDSDEP